MKISKILLVIIVFVNYSCNEVIKKNYSLIDNAHQNSSVIVELFDFDENIKSLESSNIWGFSNDFDLKNNIEYNKELLHELLDKNSVNHVLISIVNIGRKDYDCIFFIEKDDKLDIKNPKFEFSQEKYEGKTLFTINNLSVPMFVFEKKGVFSISKSKDLIKEIIRQSKLDEKLTSQEDFKEAYDLSRSEGVNIFINSPNLKGLSSVFSNKNTFTQVKSWIYMDLESTKNKLEISGVLKIKDNSFFDIYSGFEPKDFEIIKNIPSSSEQISMINFDSIDALSDSFQDSGFAGNLGFFKYFSWADNEIALVKLSENCVLIKSNDEEAQDYLNEISSKEKEYRSREIMKLENPKIIRKVFGSMFDGEFGFYCKMNGFVAFSKNISDMRVVIDSSLDNKNIANDDSFMSFYDDTYGDNNYIYFAKSKYYLNKKNKILNDDFLKQIENTKQKNRIKYFALSSSFKDNKGVFSISINISDDKESKSGVVSKTSQLWNLDLGAKIISKPFVVINHKTKAREIVVQDENNVVYLISNSGKIIWKKQISSKIISDVKQIDMYRNGKLQLLFNTKNKLFALDRKGSFVKPFPIKFSKEATAGLALFDYSKNRKYRILIPKGKTATMYDVKGKVVKGFKFSGSKNIITHKAKHFVVSGKDYIVMRDDKSLYILSRQGKTRVKVNKEFDFSDNEITFVKYPKSRIVATTKKGEVINVFFNGKVSISKPKIKGEHLLFANRKGEILANSKKVLINKKVVDIDVVGLDVEYFSIKKNNYIVTYNSIINKVDIANSKGQHIKGFPVFGGDKNVIFTAKNKSQTLVTANDDSLIKYSISKF